MSNKQETIIVYEQPADELPSSVEKRSIPRSRIVHKKKQTTPRDYPVSSNGSSNGVKTHHLEDPLLTQLALAAQNKDERSFLMAKETINWSYRPATDFVTAIEYALAAGAYVAARTLATDGNRLYPNHEELSKLSGVLAPPVTGSKARTGDYGIRLNREWIRTHSDQYHGQWIALQQGKLLGVHSSLRELRRMMLDTFNRNHDNILFTKLCPPSPNDF